MSATVVVVGCPNVGKSTFFNYLIKHREAVVDTVSDVTCDRHYGKTDWNGVEFSVIGTGGYLAGGDDTSQEEIDKQVNLATDEVDAIILMVNVEDGLTGMGESVATLLHKSKKPVFVVVNKMDNNSRRDDTHEFYALGSEHLSLISNVSGSGTGDLLDGPARNLSEKERREEESLSRFAVVGRPNAGKSPFINALIGEDHYMVTDIAGTTRDATGTKYNRFGFEFNLVDTVGICRKSKVKEDLGFYSVMHSICTIEHSDMRILMFDAARGFESQDANIFWLAQRSRRNIVILVSKWGLVEGENNTAKAYKAAARKKIEPSADVPITSVSAFNKQCIYKAIKAVVKMYNNCTKRIPTRQLNEMMLPTVESYSPPAIKGKYVKVKFCAQLPTSMSQSASFANLPQYVKDPYRRSTEDKPRENFDSKGIPIDVYFRQK